METNTSTYSDPSSEVTQNEKSSTSQQETQSESWNKAAQNGFITLALGLMILLIVIIFVNFPTGILTAVLLWTGLALVAGSVAGTVLHWVNHKLLKNTTAMNVVAVLLAVVQLVGSFALALVITPAGLHGCAAQGELVDWANGRCSYVFSGKMIDASYPITHKDERTIQDGKDVVKIGTYTVKTENDEGTIKTRDGKITENTVDPSLVGQPLHVIRGEGISAQVIHDRSLAGPLGGKSPVEEGFCYDGKLYKTYYVNRGARLEAEFKGTCPAGDDSIPHLDNQ